MALDLAWKAVAALAAGWGGGGAAVAAVWEDLRPVKSDHVGHVFPAWHHATRRSNAASKESSLAYVCSQSSREPNAKDMRLGTGRPDARTATLASALPLCRQGRPQPCPHRRRRSLELGLWKLRPVGPRHQQSQLLPKKVEAFADQRVIALSVGGDHSLALTADGAVWSWGYGALGMLGHGDEQRQLLPKEVEAFARVPTGPKRK